ncbi:LexA family transcriptional regulator [Thalassospira sp. 11-3]|uniref:LexA family transcriptional regulator n=1 Tax=Thalassospira sp. 11-3 TaxID=2135614 RepID=UPI000D76CC25|nr:LexA family transcriptional regulator [Thalassospira sp. 11-3]PXX25859.1 phage repressor protein C with HTH and peptisase S24 domain [Thalassospira sp. 11-3]
MSSKMESSQIIGFRSRLALLIGQQKPFEWAKATGIPSSTFDRVWNHEAIPRPEYLVKISRRCDVSVDWLLTGDSPLERKGNDSGTISLPMLRCSAEGEIIVDEKTEFLSLSLKFLARQVSLSTSENLGIVAVQGDSMEPTLHEDDFVVVDRSQRQISGGVMALEWDGEIHLRRITSHPSGGTIINDNTSKYPNVNLDIGQLNRLNLIGKVVLVCQCF